MPRISVEGKTQSASSIGVKRKEEPTLPARDLLNDLTKGFISIAFAKRKRFISVLANDLQKKEDSILAILAKDAWQDKSRNSSYFDEDMCAILSSALYLINFENCARVKFAIDDSEVDELVEASGRYLKLPCKYVLSAKDLLRKIVLPYITDYVNHKLEFSKEDEELVKLERERYSEIEDTAFYGLDTGEIPFPIAEVDGDGFGFGYVAVDGDDLLYRGRCITFREPCRVTGEPVDGFKKSGIRFIPREDIHPHYEPCLHELIKFNWINKTFNQAETFLRGGPKAIVWKPVSPLGLGGSSLVREGMLSDKECTDYIRKLGDTRSYCFWDYRRFCVSPMQKGCSPVYNEVKTASGKIIAQIEYIPKRMDIGLRQFLEDLLDGMNSILSEVQREYPYCVFRDKRNSTHDKPKWSLLEFLQHVNSDTSILPLETLESISSIHLFRMFEWWSTPKGCRMSKKPSRHLGAISGYFISLVFRHNK